MEYDFDKPYTFTKYIHEEDEFQEQDIEEFLYSCSKAINFHPDEFCDFISLSRVALSDIDKSIFKVANELAKLTTLKKRTEKAKEDIEHLLIKHQQFKSYYENIDTDQI